MKNLLEGQRISLENDAWGVSLLGASLVCHQVEHDFNQIL